jgi:hypothetical protein
VTFALPLGMWPKNRSLAWEGTYRGGRTYRNQAVLEVTGGPGPSPFDTRFDPHSIKRFIVAPAPWNGSWTRTTGTPNGASSPTATPAP